MDGGGAGRRKEAGTAEMVGSGAGDPDPVGGLLQGRERDGEERKKEQKRERRKQGRAQGRPEVAGGVSCLRTGAAKGTTMGGGVEEEGEAVADPGR